MCNALSYTYVLYLVSISYVIAQCKDMDHLKLSTTCVILTVMYYGTSEEVVRVELRLS
jgi:hypothetical protein